MSLAIFDLDHTLLNGDSDYAWGEFLCEYGIVDAQEYSYHNQRFYDQYLAGQMDINEFLAFCLKPLSEHSTEQLNIWHARFMQEKILPMITPAARELLQKHRERGDHLLIITATNDFVTQPIADALGVDSLLATNAEFVAGQYTGKPLGTPCFREGKVTRLKQWLTENPFDMTDSYFYSDSHNDLPMLELAEHPVATNPDEKLEAIALERGWPVIKLHE